MWVHDLRDADASCGGKAVGLARLIAAGLLVPEGFAIDDRAFRHIVGELDVSDPNAIGTPSRISWSATSTPSPRLRSVVGQEHTVEPARASRPISSAVI